MFYDGKQIYCKLPNQNIWSANASQQNLKKVKRKTILAEKLYMRIVSDHEHFISLMIKIILVMKKISP